jgi:hypothetical protein
VATWSLDAYDLNGAVRQAGLPFRSLRFSYVLNSPGVIEAQFSLTNSLVTKTNLKVAARELRVLRNSTLVWGGYLWDASVELRDSLRIRGEGYFSALRRRYGMTDLIYADVAQQQIAWNLIAATQAEPSGSLALTQGAHAGASITRDRDYCAMDHDEIAAAIEELTQLDDGIDYEITPSPDSSVNKSFKTYYPRKGSDLSGSVTLDQSKLMTLTYEEIGSQINSRVLSIGQDDCNPPEDDRTDATALSTYGLLQSIESVDSGQLRDVRAHGKEVIKHTATPHWTAQATFPVGTSGATAWGAFVVGDRITLSSNRGPSGGFGNWTQAMRVLAIDYTLEGNHEWCAITTDSVWP